MNLKVFGVERCLQEVRRPILPRIVPVHWWLLMSPREMRRRMGDSANVERPCLRAIKVTALSEFVEELTKKETI